MARSPRGRGFLRRLRPGATSVYLTAAREVEVRRVRQRRHHPIRTNTPVFLVIASLAAALRLAGAGRRTGDAPPAPARGGVMCAADGSN